MDNSNFDKKVKEFYANSSNKYGITDEILRIIILDLTSVIFGNMKVPKPWNLFKWAKFGKATYLNNEDLQKNF